MKHLVVICDSLRPDHLSCYGHTRETSPNIDSIASDGVRFTQAYSQAFWTGASSASLITGRYPLANPIGYNNSATDPCSVIG
jgi:arylsulfatase A-like enzyme